MTTGGFRMRAGAGMVVAAVAAAGALTLAQQPRGAGEASPGATITGAVVTGDAHVPVRGAIVRAGGGSDSVAFLTGGDGRFVLRGVPAGPVYVSAEKVGFLHAAFGQTAPRARPASVQAIEGASVDGLVIVLWPAPPVDAAKVGGPACSISGRLLDQFGDPLAGGVSVIAPGQDAAAIDSRAWHSSPTDADGRYCLTDLPSGQYPGPRDSKCRRQTLRVRWTGRPTAGGIRSNVLSGRLDLARGFGSHRWRAGITVGH